MKGAGEDHSHQSRIRGTTINKDYQVPEGENGVPKTRPVVSGNRGMNSHLNNIISPMLQQIGKEAPDTVAVISTEHMLQKIDKLNEKLTEKSKQSTTQGGGGLWLTGRGGYRGV